MIGKFLLSALVPVLLVLIINVIVDPFLLWGASNNIFSRKYLFDERLQKTNYIIRNPRIYEGLLIGSSRTAFIKSSDYQQLKLFNYSSSGMLPWEYDGFIKTYRAHNQLKLIIVGVDFFATHYRLEDKNKYAPEHYVKESTIKQLLNVKGLSYSRISISCSVRRICNERSYTKEFSRTWTKTESQDKALRTNAQLKLYIENYYSKNYHFDPELEGLLRDLRIKNPGVRLIAFTTPERVELFQLMVSQGLERDYKRWLNLLKDNFDEVYDFMGDNSVTRNPDNYIDAHHFSPEVGGYIMDKIEGRLDRVPKDFGVQIGGVVKK